MTKRNQKEGLFYKWLTGPLDPVLVSPTTGLLRSLVTRWHLQQLNNIDNVDPSLEQELGRERIRLPELFDELDQQLQVRHASVPLHSPMFGHMSVTITEVVLASAPRGPWTLVMGGICTTRYQRAEFIYALAFAGYRVRIIDYPEYVFSGQEPVHDGTWDKRLAADGTLALHAEVVKAIMRYYGEPMNVIGESMGGSAVLEAACDPEFAHRYILDLAILEPVGLVEKSLPRFLWDFSTKQILRHTLSSREALIKSFLQGDGLGSPPFRTFLADVNILRHKQFCPDKLARVNPAGRYEVYWGVGSPLVPDRPALAMFLEAEEKRRAAHRTPLNIVRFGTRDHAWPNIYAFGLARQLFDVCNDEHGIGYDEVRRIDSLDRSPVDAIRRRLQGRE